MKISKFRNSFSRLPAYIKPFGLLAEGSLIMTRNKCSIAIGTLPNFFLHVFFAFFLLISFNCLYGQKDQGPEPLQATLYSKINTAQITIINQLASNLRRSDPLEALLYAKKGLNQCKKINYIPGQAKINSILGEVNRTLGNYDKAIEYFRDALKLYVKLDNQTAIANIYRQLAIVYSIKGDYKLAENNFSLGMDICRTINDTNGITKTLLGIGNLYLQQGNLTKSLEHYMIALKIMEKQGSIPSANTVMNIGIVYAKQPNYPKAFIHFNKAKTLFLKTKDKLGLADSYENIGINYYNMGNIDSSLANHLQALKYYEEISSKDGIGHTYNSIGLIYSKKRKYRDALIMLEKALTIYKKIGHRHGEMECYSSIAYIYEDDKNYDKALSYFKKSLLVAEELHSLEYTHMANHKLADIFEVLKDYTNAYKHYKQYTIYKDSISNKRNSDKLLTLEVQYETKEKEKEIAIQNNEINLQKKETEIHKAKLRLLYIGSGFLVIISFLIIILLILRSKKNREILKATIKVKVKELEFNKSTLTLYTKNLLEKQKLLDELNNKLDSLEIRKEVVHPQIDHLKASKIITEEDWERFKHLFNNVHTGFFLEMKKTHIGITPAESRLAALIKINLTSQESASMLGISVESVKKTRQRLRKRMHVETDDELKENIYKI